MKEIIQIQKYDSVYIKILCDSGIAMEISEHFTFKVPGYQFMPAYKSKMWDGNIRLFNSSTCLLYTGLLKQVLLFAKDRDYDIELLSDFSTTEFTTEEANQFIDLLKPALPPRDYQIEAFVHAVRTGRALLLSPTGCHGAGTKVIMSDGSTKSVEHVVVGDRLLGLNGTREVLKLYSGNQNMIQINPFHTDPFTVNSEHIMYVWNKKTSCIETLYADQFINELDPKDYLLITACNPQQFDETEIKDVDAQFEGMRVGMGLTSSFSAVGSSIEQRRKFLAGLIEVAGTHDGNLLIVEGIDDLHMQQVTFIARSLGLRVSDCLSDSSSLIIEGELDKIHTTLHLSKDAYETIPPYMEFSVKSLNNADYYGFELDGDHLYYTDNWIVNHNSGKSFIQYMITTYFMSRKIPANKKTLLVVPTTSLVHQMKSDFISYGMKESMIHTITAGETKETSCPIIVTTWQSIFKQPKKWFDQFGLTLIDEAHLAKANSLTGILTKLTQCDYKFGFTGSLDGAATHELTLQGLLGPIKRVATTKDLIDQKHLANFAIKALVLGYSAEARKQMKKYSYQEELNYIVQHPARNKFIKNLAISLKGNTLLLFQFVDKHGQVMYDDIKKAVPGRSVYFIHGSVDGEERERIRKKVETEKDAIIIASSGTFSTGVNIKNLHNIIFTSPSKSKIRNLQSIGRGLRLSESKEQATLYDIADDFSSKSHKNYTLQHFVKRVELYNEEKFEYKLYNVQIEDTK